MPRAKPTQPGLLGTVEIGGVVYEIREATWVHSRHPVEIWARLDILEEQVGYVTAEDVKRASEGQIPCIDTYPAVTGVLAGRHIDLRKAIGAILRERP